MKGDTGGGSVSCCGRASRECDISAAADIDDVYIYLLIDVGFRQNWAFSGPVVALMSGNDSEVRASLANTACGSTALTASPSR